MKFRKCVCVGGINHCKSGAPSDSAGKKAAVLLCQKSLRGSDALGQSTD